MGTFTSRGPAATVNKLNGWSVQPVTLVNNTAKTCTHNLNQTPLAVMCFDQTNADLVNEGTNPSLTITATVNTIVLTPNASVNVNMLVIWDLPNQFTNGVLPTPV